MAPPKADQFGQSLVGEAPQSDDRPHFRQQSELASQVRQAGVALLRRRPDGGRRAADTGGDIGAPQLKPVVTADAGWLIGKPGAVQRAEDPIPRAVAGEDSPGSVAAVRGGGQADYEQLGARIAEAWDGEPPVGLIPEGCPLLACHPLAPVDETWALAAGDDVSGGAGQRITAGQDAGHVTHLGTLVASRTSDTASSGHRHVLSGPTGRWSAAGRPPATLRESGGRTGPRAAPRGRTG